MQSAASTASIWVILLNANVSGASTASIWVILLNANVSGLVQCMWVSFILYLKQSAASVWVALFNVSRVAHKQSVACVASDVDVFSRYLRWSIRSLCVASDVDVFSRCLGWPSPSPVGGKCSHKRHMLSCWDWNCELDVCFFFNKSYIVKPFFA